MPTSMKYLIALCLVTGLGCTKKPQPSLGTMREFLCSPYADKPCIGTVVPITHTPESDKRDLIEITNYAEINGKLWACPVGTMMKSEIIGEPAGDQTRWDTFCVVGGQP